MTHISQILSCLTPLALLACQAPTSSLPSIEAQPGVSISLPAEFSEAYQLGFRENPVLTAQRFLQAYDSFAKLSPVTQDSLLAHVRLHASLEPGHIRGGILGVDFNADGLITRIDYETRLRLPSGNDNAIRMAERFEFDENTDDLMTFEEAVQFGEAITARRRQDYLRPIESYLMLFDLNSDGRVLRHEVITSLEFDLPQAESAGYILHASRPMP